MQVEIDFGKASSFCHFDESTKRISTIENLMTNEVVGQYGLTVIASINNSTYSESYSKKIMLTVLPKNDKIVKDKEIV